MKILSYNCILFISFLVMSCGVTNKDEVVKNDNETKTTTTYIFVDVTDNTGTKNILQSEQIDEIISGMGLSKGGNVFNGGEVRLFLIDDISQALAKSVKIDKGNADFFTGTPELRRQEEIKKFIKNLKITSEQFKQDAQFGRTQSEIYRNLCKEFKELLEQPSDVKNVIIYSDMIENSPVFSLIKPIDNNQINAIIEKANKTCEMPNLSEISIYIVPPLNLSNKNQIGQAEKFWTKLFESKKAKTIKFSVNLNIK